MLYPTHKRFGILWGLVAIPIGVILGLIPIISFKMSSSEMLMIVLCGVVGMRGALFGAEFPDIDSPTSIPRQKHKIIGRIFDLCGVKHRGKYSHDYLSIGLTFVIIYFLVHITGERFVQAIVEGNTTLGTLAYLGVLFFVYVVANMVVDTILWVANLVKNKRMWAIVNKKRVVISLMISAPLVLILTLTGVFDIKSVFGSISLKQSLSSAMILVTSLKIYTIFSLVGAYSHLFADMLTKDGVSICFVKISPMGIISNVRKIPILGKFLVPLDPKTGGRWEDIVRYVVTGLCIPASVLAVMVMTGYEL